MTDPNPHGRAVRIHGPYMRGLTIGFILLAIGNVGGLYAAYRNTQANRDRIADIQRNRIESCQRGYEGIRQVFRPFFRPPAKRTPQERRNLAKFNRTINRLEAGCAKRVAP